MKTSTREVVSIGLNAEVMIQLTDEGKQWYCDHEAAQGVDTVLSQNILRNKEEDGWFKFMFWEFMEIFGPAMHVGVISPKLFESDLKVIK